MGKQMQAICSQRRHFDTITTQRRNMNMYNSKSRSETNSGNTQHERQTLDITNDKIINIFQFLLVAYD